MIGGSNVCLGNAMVLHAEELHLWVYQVGFLPSDSRRAITFSHEPVSGNVAVVEAETEHVAFCVLIAKTRGEAELHKATKAEKHFPDASHYAKLIGATEHASTGTIPSPPTN